MTTQKNVGWVRPEALTHQNQNMSDTAFSQAAAWPTARVGDICRSVNGRAFKPTEWTDKGIPIIRIQNLKNPDAPFNYFSGTLEDKFRVKTGDLLFAWSGTPGTSFGAHIWRGSDAALNQHIFNLHYDQSRVDAKYFCYALNRNVADYVAKAQGGVGLAHITKGKFESSEIPLPTLDQQKRIVAEIEKQFSRLDEAVANLKCVKANLKRYKAAVLKAAVEGRLVETEAELARREGRSYETGAQLLQRILETRRSQWKGNGKYKEPAAPDTTDLPELPEGWVWVSVNQIAEKVVDGTHHTPEYVSEGVPFISVKDVRDSKIHFDDTKFIGVSAHKELIKRCNPELHDVLITKSGTIGRTAVITMDRPFSLFVSVALIKPVKPFVNSSFLQIAFDAYIQSIDIAQDVKGGLLKNLHLEDLRVISIPMPPEPEQLRVVAEVGRGLSLVREVESQVDANLMRAERLRQSILGRAFTGKLVYKNCPSDSAHLAWPMAADDCGKYEQSST